MQLEPQPPEVVPLQLPVQLPVHASAQAAVQVPAHAPVHPEEQLPVQVAEQAPVQSSMHWAVQPLQLLGKEQPARLSPTSVSEVSTMPEPSSRMNSRLSICLDFSAEPC